MPRELQTAVERALVFGFSTRVVPDGKPTILDGEAPQTRGQRRRAADPELGRRAAALIERSCRSGLGQTWRGAATWPEALEGLPAEPLVLWYRGSIEALLAPLVAVVGTRTPTPYGIHATRAFTESLALCGIGIVSGLARGVDGAAHRAALRREAPTVAVLGSGLDAVYPREHTALGDEIVEHGGLLLSEYPPGHRANRGTFPRRNRILAALARAVLVVEAGRRSGTLITSEWALAYDRPLWAVPGPWSSPASEGCHRLIREGAQLADSPASLLEDLGVSLATTAVEAKHAVTDSVAMRVLETLSRGPRPLEALRTEIRAGQRELMRALQRLELDGLVEYRNAHYWNAGG